MKHKILRMHLGTWRALRGVFPGEVGETMDDYVKRIVRRLKNGK